jgi:hypothetical protein
MEEVIMRTDKLRVMSSLSISTLLLSLFIFVTACNKENSPTSALNNSSNENLKASFSKNNVIHHVSLGGADVCEALGLPTGCDANFSLVANMKADGSVSGQWQDTFAGGREGIHVAVDCMNIVGNGAVIGGVITHGMAGGIDVTGQRALTAVVDNGTSANDPPDQLSFSFFDTGDLSCDQLTPSNFPLFDLAHGQVKVK